MRVYTYGCKYFGYNQVHAFKQYIILTKYINNYAVVIPNYLTIIVHVLYCLVLNTAC